MVNHCCKLLLNKKSVFFLLVFLPSSLKSPFYFNFINNIITVCDQRFSLQVSNMWETLRVAFCIMFTIISNSHYHTRTPNIKWTKTRRRLMQKIRWWDWWAKRTDLFCPQRLSRARGSEGNITVTTGCGQRDSCWRCGQEEGCVRKGGAADTGWGRADNDTKRNTRAADKAVFVVDLALDEAIRLKSITHTYFMD